MLITCHQQPHMPSRVFGVQKDNSFQERSLGQMCPTQKRRHFTLQDTECEVVAAEKHMYRFGFLFRHPEWANAQDQIHFGERDHASHQLRVQRRSEIKSEFLMLTV